MASDRARAALTMRLAGATYREIANHLGVSGQRARNLVFAALREEARLRHGSNPTDAELKSIKRKRPQWMARG
jgi:DNA-directed RNA polymerase specialized sigma24 family protein